MVYTFEQAWLNVQELDYEQEGSYYLAGIELSGCNVTTHLTEEQLKPIMKWDNSFRTPTPKQEEEYAKAYSDIVNMIINSNSIQFTDVDGECVLIPKCVKIFKDKYYYWDIDNERWKKVSVFDYAERIVLELRERLL